MRTSRPTSASMLVAGLLGAVVPAIALGEALQTSGPVAANSAPASAATAGAPASATTAGAPASATTASAEGQKDPRPLIGLTVKNEFRPEDRIFAQLVEGRLVSDLADMETFRTTGGESRAGDFVLTCTIRNVTYDASTVYTQSRDADAPSTPQPKDQVTLSMDLTLRLEDRAGKEFYSGKLSVQANREFEI